MVVSLAKPELWNVTVDNNVMAELSAWSSVYWLVRAPRSSVTPGSYNLSSSLPKLTVLCVAPMHDAIAGHYLPSSSG